MAEWLWRYVQVNLNTIRSGEIRVGSSPTLITNRSNPVYSGFNVFFFLFLVPKFLGGAF
jgi:hypothetical protein